MTSFFALLSRLGDLLSTSDETRYPVDEDEVDALASRARGATVTADALAARDDHTAEPLVAYLEDGELPEYVLRAGEVVISDAADSTSRKHPSRETRIVVSDGRVLFVVGGRLTDTVLGVDHADVRDAYVDDEGRRPYLVVDANREGDPMTFFADVALEPNAAEVRESVAFLDESATESDRGV